MKKSIVLAMIMGLTIIQPAVYAAEKTFSFGQPPFEETAKISVEDNSYIVVCSFKPRSNKQSSEVQSMFHEQKAKGICLKAIASYRKGKKVSRSSATVHGMVLQKKLKKKDELIFVFTVPIDGIVEKDVQFVQ